MPETVLGPQAKITILKMIECTVSTLYPTTVFPENGPERAVTLRSKIKPLIC